MIIIIEIMLKFLLGLCLGSFINVVTYRIPRKISIIHPRSYCPNCNNTIKIIDNIPIFSWLRLKGRCSNCNKKISLRYITVEIAFAIIFTTCTSAYSYFNNNAIDLLLNLSTSVFLILFVSIALIDIEYLLIPSVLCLSSICLGLIFTILNSYFIGEFFITKSSIINHFYAIFIGFTTYEIIGFLGKKLFKKPALGKGDSYLAACLGAWLGMNGLLLSSLLSIYFAGIFTCVGIFINKIKPGSLIPFAPFMSIGGICVLTLGNEFWNKILFYGPN